MIGGRYFVCSLLASALLFSATGRSQEADQQTAPSPQAQQTAPATDPHASEEQAAERQALGFMQYLDKGRYADSYAYTSGLLRAKLSRDQFAEEVKKGRAPAGVNQSRELLNATYTTNMAGQPAGQYVVLQYNSNFKNKTDAVETLVMSYENGYWRVAGWFIK